MAERYPLPRPFNDAVRERSNRGLSPVIQKDTSLTLTTLTGVAAALGKKLRVELIDNQAA